MVRRWPLVRGRIAKSVVVYGIGIAMTVAKYVIYVPLGHLLTPAFADRTLRETILRSGIPEAISFAALLGVVQILNHNLNQPFPKVFEEAVTELCRTLAIAFRQREARTAAVRIKFEFLVID
jgi:hypothetical protein